MKICSIIISVVFVLILIIYLLLSSKRKTLKNIWSVVTNCITFVETLLIVKLTVKLFGNKLATSFSNLIKNVLNLKEEEWVRSGSIEDITKFIAIIVIAMISLYLVFIILAIINHLIKRFIFKRVNKVSHKEYKNKKNDNKIVNACLSLVSFAIISFTLLFPVGTLIYMTNTSAKEVNYTIPAKIKPLFSNPVLKIYGNGVSKSLFDTLTTYKYNNNKIKSSNEINGVMTMSFALLNIADDNDTANNVKIVKDKLTNTYLVPNFISDVFANAATRWKNGESFMGQTLDIPNNKSKDLYIALLDIISNWERENLISDIDTLFNFFDILDRNGVESIDDTKTLINALGKDEFNEEVFLCLFTNKDFSNVLGTFMNYGMKVILTEFNVKNDKDYITSIDLSQLSNEDIKNEAKIFSLIVREIEELSTLNSKDLTLNDYNRIVNNLSQIKNSKLLSNSLYSALSGILRKSL